MAKVEIYTWQTCPFCVRAKGLLDRKGVSYAEHSVDGDEPGRDAMAARGNGRRSVPQIFIDDQQSLFNMILSNSIRYFSQG